MENNFIQMAALAGHAVAYIIKSFSRLILRFSFVWKINLRSSTDFVAEWCWNCWLKMMTMMVMMMMMAMVMAFGFGFLAVRSCGPCVILSKLENILCFTHIYTHTYIHSLTIKQAGKIGNLNVIVLNSFLFFFFVS